MKESQRLVRAVRLIQRRGSGAYVTDHAYISSQTMRATANGEPREWYIAPRFDLVNLPPQPGGTSTDDGFSPGHSDLLSSRPLGAAGDKIG